MTDLTALLFALRDRIDVFDHGLMGFKPVESPTQRFIALSNDDERMRVTVSHEIFQTPDFWMGDGAIQGGKCCQQEVPFTLR